MPDDLLLIERSGHLCTLTLNRPEKRNALSPELLTRLLDTFKELEREEDVWVVVIRGAGDLAFSAGFDMTRLPEEKARRREQGEGIFNSFLTALLAFPRPVIAMIAGYAVGGGLELAAACDFRIAADTAKLRLVAARIGQPEPASTLQVLVNLMGWTRTKDLYFTGRIVEAKEAKEIGLVERVVPLRDLPAATQAFAQEISENSPTSVRAIKYVLTRLREEQRPSPELAAHLHEVVLRAQRSEDAVEGPRAFLEGRRPHFTGKYPPAEA